MTFCFWTSILSSITDKVCINCICVNKELKLAKKQLNLNVFVLKAMPPCGMQFHVISLRIIWFISMR